MTTLNEDIYARVVRLAAEGDELLKQGLVKEGIRRYVSALGLLPEPAHEWEAATWLFTAIGDAYWTLRDYERAYQALHSALRSPQGIGNPFIHLRMGQVQHELGHRDRAVDELLRAYMGAGKEIFVGEDPKYLQVIEDLI